MVVTRETFDSADESTKLLLLYDILKSHHDLLLENSAEQKKNCVKHCTEYNKRLKRVEHRRVLNTGVAAAGGVIGGIIAVICDSKFFK